jgi:hypothetical protein
MIALDDGALARAFLAATRVPRARRRQWLRVAIVRQIDAV